ncbi:PaaI family thioesterase [Brevibacterium album]|uniref:PaaI family thioesterase n=1 Tax=Brevibacterium album TaxID=417948 RepID=UPI0004232769|nr:PaaI family thioesterase [Brevibacterium album]
MTSVSPFAEHSTRLTRSLINALVSERDDAALAARIREIAADLSAAAEAPEAVEVSDPAPPRARFSRDITPASSARNPIAPPLVIRHRRLDPAGGEDVPAGGPASSAPEAGASAAGGASAAEGAPVAAAGVAADGTGTHESYADVVLPLQYQGPPGRVHGGIVALMLDQILGDAAHSSGLPPAFTRELTLTYDAGTPLDAEVRVSGRLIRVEGRKRFMEGEITADGTVTARARGLWIAPRELDPSAFNVRG